MSERPIINADAAGDWTQGAELFRSGQFFEAHEHWERSWLRSSGITRAYFQAWILLAGVGVHLQTRRWDPARRLAVLAQARSKEAYSVHTAFWPSGWLTELLRALADPVEPLPPDGDLWDKAPGWLASLPECLPETFLTPGWFADALAQLEKRSDHAQA